MSTIRCEIWEEMHFDRQFMEIIECPEFQRLRNIKQLGFVYTMYPDATHTRYDHSLGTAHACRLMLDILQKNSNVKINDFHQKCVIAAGLLTDVGHGPFSHAWQKIKGNRPHKERCMEVVDKILRERVTNFFFPASTEDGIALVKALIRGDATSLPDELKYLAEIVCNKYCELDVKKIDFLRRDMYYVKGVEGVPYVSADSIEFFNRAMIRTDKNGVAHIVYYIEDYSSIMVFFRTRHQFRKYVYKHPKEFFCMNSFCMLMERADLSGFHLNGQKVVGPETNLQQLDDFIIDYLKDWLEQTKVKNVALYQYYQNFMNEISKFTTDLDYNVVEEKKKTPIYVQFFSDFNKITESHRVTVNF